MRFLLAVATVFTLMFANGAQANNPKPRIKADAPNRYTVKKGDTLWEISKRYLHNPSSWKKIWATNKQLKNPHLIYPNDILILCVIKGKTLVAVDTGAGCSGVGKQEKPTVKEGIKNTPITTASLPTPKIIKPMSQAIESFPVQNIRHWLSKVMVVNPIHLQDTPYVLASKNRNLITAQGDIIYAKGVLLTVGQTYGVYKEGKPFIDPMTKAITGVEVTQVAKGVVKDISTNGISTVQLTQTFGSEVKEGDRVFADMGVALPRTFDLQPARINRPARILRLNGAVGVTGTGGVVAINVGRNAGAVLGDVLTVYRKGPLVRDVFDKDSPVRLPSEASGRIVIFRVFDHVSYAYVLDAVVPIAVDDQLLPPSS